MYQFTNTSSSVINIGGQSLAQGQSMLAVDVPLQLRSLEDQGFLRIQTVNEPPKVAPKAVIPPAPPTPQYKTRRA